MAPEQWAGTPVAATDQYALAIMAYQLLTGRFPFEGNMQQVMYKHLQERPQPPSAFNPNIPPSVDSVILKALEKKPEDRFSSIQALETAFEQAWGPTETYVPPPLPPTEYTAPAPPRFPMGATKLPPTQYAFPAPSPTTNKPGISRRTVIAGLGGLAVIAAAGGGLAWLVGSHMSSASPASTPQSGSPALYIYTGHSGTVLSVTWSPSGLRIASGSTDSTVQVWDAANGGNAYTYAGHTNQIEAVAWSPDGTRIASGGVDTTVQVWDATGK